MTKPLKPAALKCEIHRKILQFFYENEGSIDTPRGISTWINENIRTVRKDLEGLVRLGLLKAHRTSSTVGYSCPLDKKALTAVLSKAKDKK